MNRERAFSVYSASLPKKRSCWLLSITGMIAVLIISLAPISANSQEANPLKGTMFVGIVNGNTISGILPNGTKFKAHFLTGGIANYADEGGNEDSGRWRIRGDDAVCVTWRSMKSGEERCAIIHMEGRKLLLDGNTRVGEVEILGHIAADGFD